MVTAQKATAARRVDSARNEWIPGLPRQAVREQLVVADFHPEFQAVPVVDDEGRIWLQRTSGDDASVFWILDPPRRRALANACVCGAGLLI